MRRTWVLLNAMVGLCRGETPGADTTLNLEASFRLAGAHNQAILIARERVREAQLLLQQQRDQFLPWIAPGAGYRRHDGNLQDVVGSVFDVSKQSGSASVALQAQADLGETYYRVLAAKQAVAASEAQADARRRETLRAVALAYTELCRAVAHVAAAEEAVGISRQTSRQVEDAVAAGLAFAGDAQRSAVQLGRSEAELVDARLAVRLATVRLALLLRLPPDQPLRPDLNELLPVVIVATNLPLDSLVASALGNRPERRLAEATLAGERSRRDAVVKGPWWPTVAAQAGVGFLAGGPNARFGEGNDFGDYSAAVSWRLGPGGIGDRARRRAAEAGLRIAELDADALRDRIAGEVVAWRSQAAFASEHVAISSRNLASARRLFELTQDRRHFGIGAVLEAIDAERELARARTEHLRAIATHNGCQWELWYVVGLDPVSIPAPAPP